MWRIALDFFNPTTIIPLDFFKNLAYIRLYFFKNLANGATAEVDYILSRNMTVLPLEIKSGTSGKMKSLRLFMQKKHLTHAIRSSMENFSQLENDGIDIIPLYAISNL